MLIRSLQLSISTEMQVEVATLPEDHRLAAQVVALEDLVAYDLIKQCSSPRLTPYVEGYTFAITATHHCETVSPSYPSSCGCGLGVRKC